MGFYLYFLNLEFHIIVIIGILYTDYNLVKQSKIRSLIIVYRDYWEE